MLHYYTVNYTDGGQFPIERAFDDIDDAIEFADTHGIDLITEIGGYWNDLEKCEFCHEWFCSSDLNSDGLCDRCEYAINTH